MTAAIALEEPSSAAAVIDAPPGVVVDPASFEGDPAARALAYERLMDAAPTLLYERNHLLVEASQQGHALAPEDVAVVMIHRSYPGLPPALVQQVLPDPVDAWWVTAGTRQGIATMLRSYDNQGLHAPLLATLDGPLPPQGSFLALVFAPDGCTFHRVRSAAR